MNSALTLRGKAAVCVTFGGAALLGRRRTVPTPAIYLTSQLSFWPLVCGRTRSPSGQPFRRSPLDSWSVGDIMGFPSPGGQSIGSVLSPWNALGPDCTPSQLSEFSSPQFRVCLAVLASPCRGSSRLVAAHANIIAPQLFHLSSAADALRDKFRLLLFAPGTATCSPRNRRRVSQFFPVSEFCAVVASPAYGHEL